MHRWSLASQGVLKAANDVLNLSRDLIAFALTFEFAVAGNLADHLFYFALGLLKRTFNAVFINHGNLL
jgi:hypothetical protein